MRVVMFLWGFETLALEGYPRTNSREADERGAGVHPKPLKHRHRFAQRALEAGS